MTCLSGSRNLNVSLSWFLMASTATLPTGISVKPSSLRTSVVALPATMTYIGSMTSPPPNLGLDLPPTTMPLSTLWWSIVPNMSLYIWQRALQTLSEASSAMWSGWPAPLRSTISTSCSSTGFQPSFSTIILPN